MQKIYEKLTSADALLSVTSGVLLCLSFPKAEFSVCAFFSLLPLLYSLQSPGRRMSAPACGILSGLTFYLGTIYWVTLTMENYGNVPRALSLFILLLFALYLSVYTGVFAWGVAQMERTGLSLMLGAPMLWVSLEYARGHLLTGFPWALLGYSQYKNILLIQVSDVTGVYGVSFLIVLVNAALIQGLFALRDLPAAKRLAVPLLTVLISLGATLSYGAYRVHQNRVAEEKTSIRVGVVQGNIAQDEKWDPLFRDKILAVYAHLSHRAAQDHPDLILWPEASAPFFFMVEREYQSQLLALIDDLGVDLLFGSADSRAGNGAELFYNSTFLVSPGGRLQGKYDKIHLVPFGEYVPLRRVLFFVRPIIDQIGDMTPGREVTLLRTEKGACGTPICFEIIFPDLVRKFVKAGAVFIATVTNDDWFGRSSAPYQHFSMAVFRAVENHVPVVRAANSGISGLIGRDGRILRRTDIFTEEVFTESLHLSKRTPAFYTRFGDLFSGLCIAGSALLLALSWTRQRKGEKGRRKIKNPDSQS